jgi:signal transduction histidine kinase
MKINSESRPMSLSIPSNSSLYQFALKFTPAPVKLTVSLITLQTVINSLLDLLLKQQIPAIIWAKLPQSKEWIKEIERYQQQGHPQAIYWCHTRKNPPNLPTFPPRNPPRTRITPVVLETSSQLKREFFLLVLSPQFVATLIAQEEPASKPEAETLLKVPHLNLIYSFESQLIEVVLGRVKQWITITDSTPEELLMDTDLPFELPDSPPSTLVSELLFKQIQQTDSSPTEATMITQAREVLQELTDLVKFKDQLLKNLAQELSLPLTNMKTGLKLLDSLQSKREQRQRYIDLLERECQKQNVILSSLQEFIQLDQNTSSVVNPSLKLEDLIPGIVSTYQPLAEEKGIGLGYTVPAGFPPVNCPEAWLRQIILNLLSNSLKFTPPKGRVFVEAKLKNELVEIKVTDTGCGIDNQDLLHIFESFYRGKNTLQNNVSAAGLGLTMVQHLIKRCGASLNVNSNLGKGSTFTLTLPLYLADT